MAKKKKNPIIKKLKSPKTYQGASYRVMKKALGGKKSIISKLGTPGKVAIGAAALLDYVKMKQKGKKGCAPGMRKVTKNGKSYCVSARGSKKGRDY